MITKGNRLYLVSKKLYLLCFFGMFLLSVKIQAQSEAQSDFTIINLMNTIDTDPVSISFKNTLDINNQGGHLQGIQLVNYQDDDYYFLSGSSDASSYYSVVKIGVENSVISVNKVLDKPFKHAGGFQISNNIMAIGIEDNTKKDRSKIYIYKIDDPNNLPQKPLKIIDRKGDIKRATAGCVGVIEMDNNILVVVGDWDTKHLDFYKFKKENLYNNSGAIKLDFTIDTKKMDRSEWINKNWLPYQNINFIKDTSNKLYLAGMTTNNQGDNVLDLFIVETKNYSQFKLKKIYTRTFDKNSKTSFRWGAGIYLSNNNNLKIFSSGAHLGKESVINVYKKDR